MAFLLGLADILAIAGGGIAAYGLRHGHFALPVHYQVALVLAGVLALLLFPWFGVYRAFTSSRFGSELRLLALAWGGVIAILIILSFLTKTSASYSRLWLGAWTLVSGGMLFAVHGAFHIILRFLREKGWGRRRIVIAGAGPLGREIALRIRKHPGNFEAVAFVDDDPSLQGKDIEGIPVKGSTTQLGELLERLAVHELWLALPLREEERIKAILHELRHHTVDVRFVPDLFGFAFLNHGITEIAGMPVVDLSVSPMVGANRMLKAVEDYALAGLMLLIASPLMLLIALGVRLSSQGPVLFRQVRVGWDGRPFVLYKFRTMVCHTEPEGRLTQARRNDPRVTPFGRFLRRTSLDELPQLFNVLRGEMSLVGPRPHALEHHEQYRELIGTYMQRHKVKPGITGWAQVNGLRGETETLEKMERRVEYDLYYIEHWSLAFDIRILLLTSLRLFRDEKAY